MKEELLLDFSTTQIVAALFIGIFVMNELCFRVGRYVQNSTAEEVKSLTGTIQGSILGLLALLLGFTFSMSMQRYDNRSEALIDEANTIGTAILRVQLLPDHLQPQVHEKMSEYIDLRIAVGKIDLTHKEERRAYNQQITRVQNELWALAIEAAHDDPRPVTSGAFINSLNDMIDSQGKRSALLQRHVPEVVLFLLFLVFVSSGGIMGYSGGLSGSRVLVPTLMVSLLISLIVFLIIDLDRPKRGIIQVDQTPMEMLKDSL